MDLGARNTGKQTHNLIRGMSAHLVPKNNIQDMDAMPGNARPAAAYPWSLGNVLRIEVVHSVAPPAEIIVWARNEVNRVRLPRQPDTGPQDPARR